tara:strand:- start:85 stop:645 length:561 start_codon:yes stop_codon:yes gene_type:complete
METLDTLLNKVSFPILTEPLPSHEQMEMAYKAAFRAPDHGRLRPWRFIEVKNKGRENLGKAFRNAAIKNGEKDEDKLSKFEKLPLRAPMIIILITNKNQESKIPVIEQIQSTAVAAQNISLALFDMGFGVYWRTGSFISSKNNFLNEELSLDNNSEVIGYLYVGSPDIKAKTIQSLNKEDYVKYWD